MAKHLVANRGRVPPLFLVRFLLHNYPSIIGGRARVRNTNERSVQEANHQYVISGGRI